MDRASASEAGNVGSTPAERKLNVYGNINFTLCNNLYFISSLYDSTQTDLVEEHLHHWTNCNSWLYYSFLE